MALSLKLVTEGIDRKKKTSRGAHLLKQYYRLPIPQPDYWQSVGNFRSRLVAQSSVTILESADSFSAIQVTPHKMPQIDDIYD
jgi:hypothetical protein